MDFPIRTLDRVLQFLVARIIRVVVMQLDLALWLDRVRRRLPDRVRRWTGSLRRLIRRIFVQNPPVPPPVFRKKRRPWNRTPDHIEEQLAVEGRPSIVGQLVFAMELRSYEARFMRREIGRVPAGWETPAEQLASAMPRGYGGRSGLPAHGLHPAAEVRS